MYAPLCKKGNRRRLPSLPPSLPPSLSPGPCPHNTYFSANNRFGEEKGKREKGGREGGRKEGSNIMSFYLLLVYLSHFTLSLRTIIPPSLPPSLPPSVEHRRPRPGFGRSLSRSFPSFSLHRPGEDGQVHPRYACDTPKCKEDEGREPDPLRGDDVLEEEGDRSITPAWMEGEEGRREGGGEGGRVG